MDEELDKARIVNLQNEALERLRMKYKIPKAVIDVLKHYNECYVRGCTYCLDCIAFAISYSEFSNLQPSPESGFWMTKERHLIDGFIRFLMNVLVIRKSYCKRSLDPKTIKRFAEGLLKTPIEVRRKLRNALLCHPDFKSFEYIIGQEALE